MGARHVIQLGEQHRRGNLVGSSGVPGSTGRNQSRLEAFASGVEAELHAQAPSHRLEAFASVCSVTDTTEEKNAMRAAHRVNPLQAGNMVHLLVVLRSPDDDVGCGSPPTCSEVAKGMTYMHQLAGREASHGGFFYKDHGGWDLVAFVPSLYCTVVAVYSSCWLRSQLVNYLCREKLWYLILLM
jgi:hypothetical protein